VKLAASLMMATSSTTSRATDFTDTHKVRINIRASVVIALNCNIYNVLVLYIED